MKCKIKQQRFDYDGIMTTVHSCKVYLLNDTMMLWCCRVFINLPSFYKM